MDPGSRSPQIARQYDMFHVPIYDLIILSSTGGWQNGTVLSGTKG